MSLCYLCNPAPPCSARIKTIIFYFIKPNYWTNNILTALGISHCCYFHLTIVFGVPHPNVCVLLKRLSVFDIFPSMDQNSHRLVHFGSKSIRMVTTVQSPEGQAKGHMRSLWGVIWSVSEKWRNSIKGVGKNRKASSLNWTSEELFRSGLRKEARMTYSAMEADELEILDVAVRMATWRFVWHQQSPIWPGLAQKCLRH